MDIIAYLGKLSAKEIHKKFINYQAKLFLRGYSPSIQIGHISGGIGSIGGLFTQPQASDGDLSQLDYDFNKKLDEQVVENQERLNEQPEQIPVQKQNVIPTMPPVVLEITDKENRLFEVYNEGDPYESLRIQMAEAFENAANPKHESTVEFLEALRTSLNLETKGGGFKIKKKLEELETAETIPKLSLTADDIEYLLTKNLSYKKMKSTKSVEKSDSPAFLQKDIFEIGFQDVKKRFKLSRFKNPRPEYEQLQVRNAAKYNKLLKEKEEYTRVHKLKHRNLVTDYELQDLKSKIEAYYAK